MQNNTASLEADGSGLIRVSGVLDFQSVPALWGECANLFDTQADLQVDLSRVERSNSAGLAFLITCLREAERRGKGIHFANIPEQMLAIARVSGVDTLLAL